MSERSDARDGLAEQRRRADWPSESYLMTRFALQVARQFEQLRQEQGLSYEQLAAKAGTSKAHVIRMLSGDYEGMSNKSLAKLAAALDAQIDVRIRHVPRTAHAGLHPPTAGSPRAARPFPAIPVAGASRR